MFLCWDADADVVQYGYLWPRRISKGDVSELEATLGLFETNSCICRPVIRRLAVDVFAQLLIRGNRSREQVDERSNLAEK